jgi:hypothetical protein
MAAGVIGQVIGMTEGNETSENVGAISHSDGEPDPMHRRSEQGSDVGGPDRAGESATEDALTDTASLGAEDDPGSQAANPN